MSLRTLAVSFVLAALMTSTALAGDPNQVFKGKIMTSTKRYPLSAKSKDAYIAAVRKQSASNFQENKDTHTWKIFFAAFLKVPLNDVEYKIRFVDVTGGANQVLGASEAFNDERGQKTIVSNITLDKKSFGVNKQIMMTIETSQGTVLASTRFKILGEGEKFTGKVNFSDDEAQGK
ncbi:MAG TPA: hypothetical protein VLB44_00830, partial [Kofleriaceae bacterium]|nr:hypothetical protein [Kofleriaceae bacterium]